VSELIGAEEWLYATLTGDSALAAVVGGRVFSEQAPRGTPLPAVIFSFVVGNDVVTSSQDRIMVDALYTVRGTKQAASYDADLVTIANRIDALLQRSDGGSGTGAVVFTSYREEPLKRIELDEGIEYRALGGTYRILAQQS